MFNKNPEDVTPFDSLRAPYKLLEITGIYPVKRSTAVKNNLQRIYVYFIFLLLATYLYLHFCYVYKAFDKTEELMESIYLNIPHIAFSAKALAVFYYGKRIDKIHELMKGPYFAAKSVKDQSLIVKQYKSMGYYFKVIQFVVLVCSSLLMVNVFANRLSNASMMTLCVPFKLDTWPLFLSAFIWNQTVTSIWFGFDHISIDLIIANYFSQARVQLEILRNNLEHLFYRESENFEQNEDSNNIYDETKIEEKLIGLIDRYDKIYWFITEIIQIFQMPLFITLLLASGEICIVIYSITRAENTGGQTMFLLMLVFLLLTQILLYCYFGALVQYESRFINDSLYLGNWESSSPRTRKMLLIAMVRWSRPITPKVAKCIPLTLKTFLNVIQTAYSLRTLLNK